MRCSPTCPSPRTWRTDSSGRGSPRPRCAAASRRCWRPSDSPARRRRAPPSSRAGQRQRVALARAIVKRPRLLLLDEPLSALDRKVRAEMQLELKRLQHEVGITFVVVTHDQEEAMSMADRIAVMHDGRVQQVDTPVDLYQQPANTFVADFIGSSNSFTGTRTDDGRRRAGARGPARTLRRHRAGRGGGAGDPPRGHSASSPRVEGRLTGTVLDTQFYGGRSTIAVDITGHASPVTHHRPGHGAGAPGHRRRPVLGAGPGRRPPRAGLIAADDPAQPPDGRRPARRRPPSLLDGPSGRPASRHRRSWAAPPATCWSWAAA